MINFHKHILNNGLTLLIYEDNSTPMACVNILYNVGSRDENPNKTGFAHLFEHLMFGGSENIPKFDTPLEKAGGENNAFTNADITNYYITIPAKNLETALWLESDRMNMLAFSEKSLDVQRKVVIEEYKQRYLNQPYGDLMLLFKPLAYKKHPYQWNTIGKDISHIEDATMDDVKDFYERFYNPCNAIMCISGNVKKDETIKMVEKWFGGIKKEYHFTRNLPQEEPQKERRFLEVEKDVPSNRILKAWPMCSRTDKDYHTFDIISDILSNGKSSRFNENLVRKNKIFSKLDCYISGNIDNGLVYVSGEPVNGISLEQAEQEVQKEIQAFIDNPIEDKELKKVLNIAESNFVYEKLNILNISMNLCLYDLIGNPNLINTEVENYQKVTKENIVKIAKDTFVENKENVLYYKAKK